MTDPGPPDIDAVAGTVMDRFGCHAVILYGSRAAGRHQPDSDIDLVALRREPGYVRDTLHLQGLPVDISVYGEADAAALPAGTLRFFAEGRFLVGDAAAAEAFLTRARAAAAAGPAPMTHEERRTWRAWADKTNARIHAPGEAAATLYRRGWLAMQLYELHYQLRGRWDPKIDEGFAEMARTDPALLSLFEDAQRLEPGPALRAVLETLVGRVFAAPTPADT